MPIKRFVTSTPSQPRRVATTLAIGLSLISTAASATDGDPQAVDQAGPAKKAKELGVVHVDAAATTPVSPKFTASLLNTPRAVSVISADQIQSSGATTLADALRNVPGITFGAGEGGSPINDIPYIRGFDSSSDISIDGVRDIGAQTRESFDIAQIDVIKGPSSIYSGKGAAGGSINITTKAPELENFTNLGIGVGTDDYKRATFDGNYVLGAHTAARLDVLGQDANVPGRHDVGGKRSGFAPSISFGLGTANRLTIKYYHLYTNELPDSGIPYNYATGKPIHTDTDNFYGLTDRDFRKTHANIGSVHVEHDFNDDWTLNATARYGRTSYNYIWTSPDDGDGNVANGDVYRVPKSRIGGTDSAVGQVDLTGKFDTMGIAHSVDIGVEVEHDKTKTDQYTVTVPGNIAGSVCNPALLATYTCTTVASPDPNDPWTGSDYPAGKPTTTRTNTHSFYGLDTLTFSEHWMANLGARFDDYSTAANGYNARATNGPVGAYSYGNQSSFWSGQAGLLYKPVTNGTIYVSWATSTSPSGLANGEGDQHVEQSIGAYNNLAPQKSRNLELGTKWDLLDNHLSLSAAVFKAEMTNALVQTSTTTYALAGTKKVNGFELGLAGKINDQWNLTAGYSHLNPTLQASGALATTDGDGKQFPNTAKNSATAWTYYQPTARLRFGLGVYAMSKQYGNVTNTLGIPGYTRLDAMADFRVNKHLDLQLNVLNLTNRVYYTQAYAIAFAQEAPARSAMLTANIHL